MTRRFHSSSSIGLSRCTSSIPDIEKVLKNRSSPTAIATHLHHQHPDTGNSSRNGGSINRGIEFLRNAFFGNGGTGSPVVGTPSHSIDRNGSGSNGNDSKEYRRQQSRSYQPNADLHAGRMFDPLLVKSHEQSTDNHVTTAAVQPQPVTTSIEFDMYGELNKPPRPLRNGFVLQSPAAHQYTIPPPSASSPHQSTTNNASPTTQISNTPADHQQQQHPAGPQTQEFELKLC